MAIANLRVMPLAANLLGTPSTSQPIKGFRPDALTDALDYHEPYLDRCPVIVTAGTRDTLYWTDDGVGNQSCTLTPATYVNPAHFCAHAAAQMNAAGGDTDHTWSYRQDDAARNRYYYAKGAGTTAWRTGSQNALPAFGFNDAAYSAAATHLAPYARLTPIEGVSVQWDGTTAKPHACAAIVRPVWSRGGQASFVFGATAAAETATENMLEHDDRLMVKFFASAQNYRFCKLKVVDESSEDLTFVGAHAVYCGPFYELQSANWSPAGSGLSKAVNATTVASIEGHSIVTEVYVGDQVTLDFGGHGLGPTDAESVASILRRVGTGDEVIVCQDPTNEPTRSSGLYRVDAASASMGRAMTQSPLSRYQFRWSLTRVA